MDMKMIELLDRIQETIENASAVPFSSKIMLDPDEMLDMLDEVRAQFPIEIQDARRIKDDEQRILDIADKRAKSIKDEAERKMKELVDTDEITKNAVRQAEQILKDARQQALSLQIGMIDYSNNLLKDLQEDLRNVISTIEENKNELKEMRRNAGSPK